VIGVAVWDDLKLELVRLRDRQPGPLLQFPTPEVDAGREPPFTIGLQPWATAAAEELHREFGANVILTVGLLSYPPGAPRPHPPATDSVPDLLDPTQIAAELDGRAVVRSGQTLRHGLLLHNATDRELQVRTNGSLTAAIVDPRTGDVVGGFAGAQALPLVIFRIAPAQTGRVPLLIGTASCTHRLGYAVPPGDWAVRAILELGPVQDESGRRRTPALPLTVVA
jgi:hypothetical protein